MCMQAAEACVATARDAAMSYLTLHVTEHSYPLCAKQVIAPLKPIMTLHLSNVCLNMNQGKVPCEQQ